MSGGTDKPPLAERRATYLMGLQTAVVEGEIEDENDRDALEHMRRDLNISPREHDLLMESFIRDRPRSESEELKEAYLFHKNGALLGYVARIDKGASEKTGMMATMLTTVGKFSQDALRRGGDSVEAIEYGNVTVIVEVEGDIALGVILEGKDNPNVRQRMRDVLRLIHMDYAGAIDAALGTRSADEMQAARQKMKGIESLLRRFLDE
jgi:hypothetical protein